MELISTDLVSAKVKGGDRCVLYSTHPSEELALVILSRDVYVILLWPQTYNQQILSSPHRSSNFFSLSDATENLPIETFLPALR